MSGEAAERSAEGRLATTAVCAEHFYSPWAVAK